MGAFCVFGISKTACKLAAERKQPTFDKELNRSLTKEEWAVKRDELAVQLFEEAQRRVKVSPEFDAPPSFAKAGWRSTRRTSSTQ